ncbi:proteasome component [Xylariomycetidae sp. FL2044]|nr:proteasome component [Xylariomycetidae sp. FL2044]
MSASNEGAELRLVSSIRYKFANVSGDEKKLGDALHFQLVPLLEKAGSQHKAVRDAVFQAFISVSNFIKPVGVILPVASLLEQYKHTSSPMVKQLDLSLIKQGILRLDQQKRRELLPMVLKGISQERNPAAAAGFFNICLRLLLDIKIPGRGTDEDNALRVTVGLSNSSDAEYVSSWLGKLFLLRQDLALATDDELDQKLATAPAGLTKGDVAFLRNNNPNAWRPNTPNNLSLPECKTRAINFLASGAFKDSERHLPAICASGSADSRIALVADDILKRSNVDLENRDVIRALYQAHASLPAAQRTQILKLISKSSVACTFKTEIVEAVKRDFDLASGKHASAQGLEALRLHTALLAFLAWVARNNSASRGVDHDMAPTLVLILKDYILKQGWPEPTPGELQYQQQDGQRLRAVAYETIGTLARGSNFEPKAKESILKWLFDSLVSDPSPDIVVYIESALSSMMNLFAADSPAETGNLEILLLDYMTLPPRQGIRTARHVAARFANNCLPYDNMKARWIDMLALSGGSSERRDVLEEGQRGLDPWWAAKFHPDDQIRLPAWADVTRMLFDSAPRTTTGDEMDVDQTSKYASFPNDRLEAFPVAIRFVKQILLLTASKTDQFEIDWEAQLETKVRNDLVTRQTIKEYFKSTDHDALLVLLNAALDGLRDHPDTGAEDCIQCLADVLSFSPTRPVIVSIAARVPELLPVIRSNNQKIRELGSQVFGILAPWNPRSSDSISQLRNFVETCQEPSASQSAEYQGSLTGLAGYLSRANYYGKTFDVGGDSAADALFASLTHATGAGDAGIKAAALNSLAIVWTANLCYPQDKQERASIVESLAKLAAAGNEAAIRALGRLAISPLADDTATEPAASTTILEELFKLSEIKRTEVHFATGEAIAAVIARWDSEAVRLDLDVEAEGSGKSNIVDFLRKRPGLINDTLDLLIKDCKATKPSLLKASGIWLFCVIQYCSHLPEIQSRLRESQVAFMRLLTARDELVQETASRGLSLVYERGDQSLKGDLIKDLVASFTGTKTQLKVDDDTELFDAGALPTGEGKSITSYRDIISLANEVGDQSLVYKFMALATNAATWTARSAFGRFGLSNILSDAELDPKIYPKLYRYRFDPNSNVRRSMDDIWKAVVKDQNVVMERYFDAIMDDLLKSILDGREWRVREASCAAIAELIYGQPFPKYEKYYTDIWRVTLRVVDDQKGSVREAALKLCMGLSKTLVTQLRENNSSASARAMIAQVLPFLMSDKGVENSVAEVKYMAIFTVRDVVKNGGDALKPFLSSIIIHFLGLLSTVEPEAINYYYQRVSEEDREDLDKARSNAATRSPLFECVSNCLRFVDEDVMRDLAPQLVSTIKSALGMQTKIGCSEVLSTFALRHSILLPPYNAMFLKAMETQILDRNHEASKAYARSTAYLLRSASSESRDRFTSRLADLYFSAEDDTRRQKIADTVLAIAKVSPDAFTDLESHLLPFSYLAKHDTDDYVSEEFSEVWNQHAGGSHTVKRYVPEIMLLVARGLETSKWALQHGAGLAIASTISALSSAVGRDGQFSDADLRRIWPVLDKALSLKTFKGKEKLVVAYPLFIRHGKKLWTSDAAFAAQTKKIAIREAKRNNDEYRPHALEALATFAAARDDVDMQSEVASLVSDYLTPDDEAHKLTELERKTAEAAVKAAMSSYNRHKMENDPVNVLSELAKIMEVSKQAISLAKDTWFSSVEEIMSQAALSSASSSDPSGSSVAHRWFTLLVMDEDSVMLESLRSARAKALGSFVKAWKKGVFGPASEQVPLREEMQQKLRAMMEAERSLDVKKLLEQVVGAI